MTEFDKFAKEHIDSLTLNQYKKKMNNLLLPKNFNPATIIEERQLNVAVMDVFSRLMMDRIIFLGEVIDDEVSNIITAQLLFLDSTEPGKDISIYINSPGGNVYAGFGIYDTMQYIQSDVSTICTGMAASMASVLLAAGENEKRFALPHSRIMIHQPMGGLSGQASDMEIEMKEMNRVKKELYEILSNHTGKPYKTIVKNADRDFWMTSKEAVEYGIIDEVLTKQK